jgi:polyisoprenoid-binding protein YceI
MALAGRGAPDGAAHLVLDPEATRIHFVLPTTVSAVRGHARLARGEIRLDPSGGRTSGEIVVAAASTETGIGLRDSRMHREVLEVSDHPEIVFLPEWTDVLPPDAGDARVRVRGLVAIHGTRHPVTISARVRRDGHRVRIAAAFEIPYVEWGMKDMQTLFLETSPRVQVEIDAVAHVRTW